MVFLDKASVDVKCPKCEFILVVQLFEIRREEVIICRGCKSNVKLVDRNRSFTKLEDQIRGLFK